MEQKFTGSGVALVTPFNTDNRVDYQSLENITTHLVEGGIDFLVVHGTTSEAPTLTTDELSETLKTVKQNAQGLPIVLGLGGNNTSAIIEKIKKTDFTDIAGILSVTPYYNKPSQQGLYQHFKLIAEVSPVPIILYNVPSRTGSNLEAATVVKLAREFDNIVAIKAASGDLIKVSKIIETAPTDFTIISGDDSLTLPIMSIGGKGCISVLGNALPKDLSTMVNFALDNDFESAQQSYLKIANMCRLIFQEGNPTGIKSLMHQLNLLENCVRLPLVKSSNSLDTYISKELELIEYYQ